MSDVPSWEYKIMQRHLSSSCAPASDSQRVPTHKGRIFYTGNCLSRYSISSFTDAGCGIGPDTIHHCAAPHKSILFLLILTHHHSNDPFLSPLGAQHRVRAEQWSRWPFHLWGFVGGGDCESQAEVMWPAETQTAAGEAPSFVFIPTVTQPNSANWLCSSWQKGAEKSEVCFYYKKNT